MDLTAIRGDTLVYDLEFKGSDGNPLDISGSTVVMTVRSGGTIIFSVSTNTHIDPLVGLSQIRVESSNWPDSCPSCCKYDMQITESDNTKTTFLYGKFNVINDITK